jgi:hypothetical protein
MEIAFNIICIIIGLVFLLLFLLLFVKFPILVIESFSEELGNKLLAKKRVIYFVVTVAYMFLIVWVYSSITSFFFEAFIFLLFFVFLILLLRLFVHAPLLMIKLISEDLGNKLLSKVWIIYLIAIIIYLFWVGWFCMDVSNDHYIF